MQKKSEAFPKKIYLKPALEERLAQILAVPLTVAAAPFGYGKTTAVKKVLLSLSVDMLWDTCYTGAEAAFWRCFVKSLQTLDSFAKLLAPPTYLYIIVNIVIK